jgi:MT-A70 protein
LIFQHLPEGRYRTLLVDPPWRFKNRTTKVSPEHKRLYRYDTLTTYEIRDLPIPALSDWPAHLYLWVPNALIAEALYVMRGWGFTYKGNLVWLKTKERRGTGRARVRLLLPERDRVVSLRRQGASPHERPRPAPGELPLKQEARAFPKARGTVRDH